MRAIIYCRVSTFHQETDGTGLTTQQEQARLHCATRGHTVVDVVSETHSGADYEERQELMSLIKRLRKGDFDVLVVWRLDRLSRKMVHQALVMFELDKWHVKLESVNEPSIDDTPVGRYLANTYAFMAELEREAISMRTLEGKRQRAKNGKLPGSKNPLYGYRWPDDGLHERMEIHPPTASVVRLIFDMRVSGSGYVHIAKFLTNHNVPTPWCGKHWDATAVKRILTNPAYWGKGTAFHWKKSTVSRVQADGSTKTVRHVERVAGIPLPVGVIPALISEEQAEQVQRITESIIQPVQRQRTFPLDHFLVHGIAFCGHCGSRLSTGAIGSVHYAGYQCGAYRSTPGKCRSMTILVNRLDPLVWREARDVLRQPDRLAEYLREMLLEPVEDIASLQNKLAEIEKQMRDTAMGIAVLNDEVTSAPMQHDLDMMRVSAAEFRKRIDANAIASLRQQDALDSISRVHEWAQKVDTQGEFTYAEKRRILLILGAQVKVYKYGSPRRYEVQFNPLRQESNVGMFAFGGA